MHLSVEPDRQRLLPTADLKHFKYDRHVEITQ